MARRKKGRDISGWIVIDKPAGLTSNAVVGKVRFAFQAKKAGHAGTLDPAATGVLALALGEKGCDLALVDVNEQGMKDTKNQLRGKGLKITLHVADVSDERQCHVGRTAEHDDAVDGHGAAFVAQEFCQYLFHRKLSVQSAEVN